MMPRMVCVPCRMFFRPKKNGVAIEEGMPSGDGTWAPYKLWEADLWVCLSCGSQVVAGFGHKPLAEHYQTERYARIKAVAPPLLRVDDCG